MSKRIMSNLDAFGTELLQKVMDMSVPGRLWLDTVVKKTIEDYVEPKKKFLKGGVVYQHTRKREKPLLQLQEDFNAEKNPLMRIETLFKFLRTGKWKTSSANMRLMIHLIESVPGYNEETQGYLMDKIIDPLTELMADKYRDLLKDNRLVLQNKKEREEEMRQTTFKRKTCTLDVDVFDDRLEAESTAQQYPEKSIFYIQWAQTKWQVFFCDPVGKMILLPLSKDSIHYLDKIKNHKLAYSLGDLQENIKTTCKKMLSSFIEPINLLIDPNPVHDKFTSTFVLITRGEKPLLDWYDCCSRRAAIALENYPQLQSYLMKNIDSTSLVPEQLKTYLLQIPTHKAIDEGKQTVIESMLQKKTGVSLLISDTINHIPRYRLTPGVYMLTRACPESDWVLMCREKGGINRQVDTKTWHVFNRLLHEQKNRLPNALSEDVREKLRDAISHRELFEVKHPQIENQPVRKLDMQQFASVVNFFQKSRKKGEPQSSQITVTPRN